MLALVRFASVRHVYFCCYRCLLCRRSAFSETIRDVIYWVSLGSLDFRAGIVRWIRRAVFFFLFCFVLRRMDCLFVLKSLFFVD